MTLSRFTHFGPFFSPIIPVPGPIHISARAGGWGESCVRIPESWEENYVQYMRKISEKYPFSLIGPIFLPDYTGPPGQFIYRSVRGDVQSVVCEFRNRTGSLKVH